MNAYVKTSVNKPPTVPSWFSEMLPLSFDLASDIKNSENYMEDYLLIKKINKKLLNLLKNIYMLKKMLQMQFINILKTIFIY